MSQKSPVSNFTSADNEVLAFLSNLGQKWHKSDDVANFIERDFTFVGSKPLLQNLKDYKTADCENFADIKNFLSLDASIQSKILSGEISYVGDSLTSVELKFAPECFYDFLKFIVENQSNFTQISSLTTCKNCMCLRYCSMTSFISVASLQPSTS